jgi:hypothetical protein
VELEMDWLAPPPFFLSFYLLAWKLFFFGELRSTVIF